jgi:hypothetical protein
MIIKLILAAIAVEAVTEILIHSELFAWLRKLLPRLMTCGWCLSLWIAAGVWGLIVIDLWPPIIVLVIHRLSNLIHEIYGRVRR